MKSKFKFITFLVNFIYTFQREYSLPNVWLHLGSTRTPQVALQTLHFMLWNQIFSSTASEHEEMPDPISSNADIFYFFFGFLCLSSTAFSSDSSRPNHLMDMSVTLYITSVIWRKVQFQYTNIRIMFGGLLVGCMYSLHLTKYEI